MLVIGGPAHGTERELPSGELSTTVIVPSPDGILNRFEYLVRNIEAETRPGMVYRKTVLVDSQMPIEVAAQALAAVLLQKFSDELVRQFMEGGELVGPIEDLNGLFGTPSGE